jgi:hypothetical protein
MRYISFRNDKPRLFILSASLPPGQADKPLKHTGGREPVSAPACHVLFDCDIVNYHLNIDCVNEGFKINSAVNTTR